jgi:hypothetical protein
MPVIGINDTELHTWFERDRAHVELRVKDSDDTIVEWWDEEVAEAIEDGFISDKAFCLGRLTWPDRLHGSVYEYAKERGMLPEAEPEEGTKP